MMRTEKKSVVSKTRKPATLEEFGGSIMKHAKLWTLSAVVALICFGATPAVRAELVALYTFEDGTAADASGNGLHGEVIGPVQFVYDEERGGTVIELDGSSSYINLGNPPELDFSVGGNATVAAWINMAVQKNHNQVFAQGEWRDGIGISIKGDTNPPNQIWTGGRDTILSDEPVPVGQWTHVAVTVSDNYDVSIYINGELVGTGVRSHALGSPAAPGSGIGREWRSTSPGDLRWIFAGRIDDVQLFNVAIPASEVPGLMELTTRQAMNPIPANGAIAVPVDTTLSWEPGDDPNIAEVVGYTLYLDPNEAKVAEGDPATLLSAEQEDNSIAVSGLEHNTPYFWRVDTMLVIDDDPNLTPITVAGKIWSFTTIPLSPFILGGPQPTWVLPGDTAELTVTATSPTPIVYRWYQVGDDADVLVSEKTDDPTLIIENVQIDDEGYYYCILSNPAEVQSASAYLTVNRQIARWEFEDSLEDITGNGWNGVAKRVVDRETLLVEPIEPSFDDDGISGKSLSFTAEDDVFVDILGSTQGFGFLTRGFTLSFWTKSTQTGWGTYLSKSTRSIEGEMDAWQGVCMAHNGGDTRLQLRGTTGDLTASSALAINNGQWRHVAATYDAEAQVARLYVDGRVRVTRTGLTAPVNPTTDEQTRQPFIFGNELTIDPMTGDALTDSIIPYDGLLDDVRVWNYPLTQTDIGYLYVEYEEPFCVSNPALDLSGNCRVDISDLAIFAQSWLDCNLFPECVDVIE